MARKAAKHTLTKKKINRKKKASHRPAKKKTAKKKRAVKKRIAKKAPAKKRAVKKRIAKKAPAKKRPVKKRIAKKAPIASKRRKVRRTHKASPATGKKKRKHVHPSRRPTPSDVRRFLGAKGWKKFALKKSNLTDADLSRAAAQMAERFAQKIARPGHKSNSVEWRILMNLIVAEQDGTLNESYYDEAGDPEYETPQDVYRLWIYSGA